MKFLQLTHLTKDNFTCRSVVFGPHPRPLSFKEKGERRFPRKQEKNPLLLQREGDLGGEVRGRIHWLTSHNPTHIFYNGLKTHYLPQIIQFVFILCLLLIIPTQAQSPKNIMLVTYGPEAPIAEGDDDFRQVIFFQVPETVTDSLYLRIFDPDCGDDVDMRMGSGWTTEIVFSLYGGTDAFSAPSLKGPFPETADLQSGTLLKTQTFGQDALLNNEWYNFFQLMPGQGEKVGDSYFFKLVVQGKAGDDANVFDVRLSAFSYQNEAPGGVKIFSYAPTVRLGDDLAFADLRFFIPEATGAIQVHNFDLSHARIGVETAFRSNLPVTASAQGEWANSEVRLDAIETGRDGAIRFGQGGETPNDAVFYLKGKDGAVLPITLPVSAGKLNARPQIRKELLALSDCYSIVFDAQQTADKDGDILSYRWEFGDGESTEGSRVVHRYSEQRSYQAMLIVSDNSGTVGNSGYDRFQVVVNQPPVAKAGEDVVAAPGDRLSFDGSASSDSDGRLTRFLWDWGDKQSTEGSRANHTYAAPGAYEVALRVEDDSDSPCNFAIDNLKVWINDAPLANAGEDKTNSAGNSIRFDGSGSIDEDGEIIRYDWDFGDGSNGSGKIAEHRYAEPGVYTVKLTVTDNAKVKNSRHSDELTVVVNHPPVARAGDDVHVADGATLAFDGTKSVDADGDIVEYIWTLDDGNQKKGAKITHTYASPGEYAVSLAVRDNSGTDSNIGLDTLIAKINAQPVANAGEDQLVTSSDVQFDGSASQDSDGQIIAYHWDFGDGESSADAAPQHVYRSPGIYLATLTVTDNSNTANRNAFDEVEIIVNEKPVADAGPDQIAAPEQTLQFDGSNSFDPDGDVASYHWDFGDGNSGKGMTVSHHYQKPGVYTVQLTVQDNTDHEMGLDFDEALISVNRKPVAAGGADVIAAPGDEWRFDAANSYDLDGNLANYQWQFSDKEGELFDTPEVKRTFGRSGVYTALLTVRDDSGAENDTDRDTISIRINNAPIARAGKIVNSCDYRVYFDASASTDPDGDPLAYTWDFGDGSAPVNGVTANHQFAEGGIYPVVLTVDDGHGLTNSIHSVAKTVIVNAPPVADAGPDTTRCAGEVVIFNGGNSVDPEGGALRYQWDFGDGNSGEGLNPIHVYTQQGIYQVTLTVEDDSGLPCNTDTDRKVVIVSRAPVALAGADMTVCANTEVRFDGNQSTDTDGVVNSYQWDFGDGTKGGGPTPVHVYPTAGIYRVNLTVSGDVSGDCPNTDTDELIVTVHEAPLAAFQAPDAAPINTSVFFDASTSVSENASIVSYEWDFGDGNKGNGKTASHTYKKPGAYRVILTVRSDAQNDCNFTSAVKQVLVNQAPLANAGADQTAGINEDVHFNASASMDADGAVRTFSWDFGDGNTGNGVVARHRYQQTGRFPVVLTIEDHTDLGNNAAQDTAWVTVNAMPIPKFTAPAQICDGERITFDGSSSRDLDGKINAYEWDLGDGNTAKGVSISHQYQKSGVYEVTLTITDDAGVENSRASITQKVMVNNAPIAIAGGDQIVCPGESVRFDGSQSFDRDGDALQYQWDFGDGQQGSGKIVNHQYASAGKYQVTLTVSDGSAGACSAGRNVISVIVNNAPIANAGGDKEGFSGGAHDAILFDGSQSSDADRDALTYTWDFGDGSSGSGAKVFHTYQKPGSYEARLTVSDGWGNTCSTSSDRFTVIIKSRSDYISKGN